MEFGAKHTFLVETALAYQSRFIKIKNKGIKIEFAEVNEDGEVTLESIEKKINSKTKVILFNSLKLSYLSYLVNSYSSNQMCDFCGSSGLSKQSKILV